MSLPQSAAELLASLAEVLETRGVRWYVFGAQAVILWGAPRLSADVNATVQIALEKAADLAKDMARVGFELRIQDLEGFVAETRVLPFLHAGTGMPVDVTWSWPFEWLSLEPGGNSTAHHPRRHPVRLARSQPQKIR